MADASHRAATLFTRAMMIMAAITLMNMVLGLVLIANPRYFIVGILAWVISLMVWFEIACRALLQRGERPWR
jgi:hypothetical protein